MKNNNKGFSLVELIIVIAIMAILVGVMAPQIIKYIEKANVSADMQLLDAVYDAVVYASVDPDVITDPASRPILDYMVNNAIALEDLQNQNINGQNVTGNYFCQEVISTLGWNNLNQPTYEGLLKSAHGNGATIYFTYKGDFVNPIIMWITTTDASGKKDTSYAPNHYDESDAGVMGEIRSCIHIE